MTEYTPEQQKEHRRLWVEALRSGKYQQGTGVLRNSVGAMCCLGVACEISGLVKWGELVGDEEPGFVPVIEGPPVERFYAPKPVVEWLGLANGQGKWGERFSHDGLADKNDAGKPFAEIADIIEAEPAGLIATPVEV